MTQSLIGPNTAIRYLKDYNAHTAYWHEVNPTYLLAYVDKPLHTPYLLEYAAAFPDSMIVARIQHPLDGGFHLAPTGAGDTRHYVASPIDYHNQFGYLGATENIILSILNEPDGFAGDDDIARLIAWMMDYIALAVPAKTKSVLFNWGDRQPRIIGGKMDARFGVVLKKMAEHPELFWFGMHGYGPDDITEHIQSYVELCKSLNVTPPKVIFSEFGFDANGDGKGGGYKARGVGGGEYAAWQISQVQHDLSRFTRDGVLVGLTVFQEGNSGGWQDFDIETDTAYKDEIKRAAKAGELTMILNTIQNGKLYHVAAGQDMIPVYLTPVVDATQIIGKIPNDAVVTAGNAVRIGGDTFIQVQYPSFKKMGWILKASSMKFTETMTMPVFKDDLPVTKPLPDAPQPPPTNGTPPAPVVVPKPAETPQNGATAYVSKSTSLLDCLKVIQVELSKAIELMEKQEPIGV